MTSEQSIFAVEALLAIPFLLLGISHIVQKQMWARFFINLAKQGTDAVIWRTLALELWAAIAIVVFHQDWSWPGMIITVYGHLLMTKVAISLLAPQIGMRSLAMAETYGEKGMIKAGVVLVAMGAFCAWRVL